jgi:type IV pilus assembly protein PilC
MYRLLIFLSLVISFAAFFGLAMGFLLIVGVPPVLAVVVPAVVCGGYAWALLSFFHYRYLRQEEFLHLLMAAVDAQAPLAPAVFAYAEDRPRSTLREFLVAVLLFIVPGYYWLWHRRHRFDRKVEQVALRLEAGYPLYQALLSVPGVASRETVLAAAIGESTGQLGPCLQKVPGWRLTHVWMDAIPRLVYPVLLMGCVLIVASFVLIFIVPKYEKIFADLKVRLPETTEFYIGFGRWVVKYGWVFVLTVVVGGGLLIASSSACWHCPGLGTLYRMHARGRLLRMLAIMLEAGDTVPEALQLLTDSGYFGGTVLRRLKKLRHLVEMGEPLAGSLYQVGLLPHAMLPLLEAAERARNLPWAMAELGDHLGKRSVRISQRFTAAIFPLTVIGVGVVVGTIVVGLFLPLVKLLTELSL